ncbi:hypothetical protein ACR0S5_27295 [Priestia megaterium]|uniref:hypothetical protein n=1 Tax=Priestia megaterium TaxID=1404 RepID=UPI003D9804D4
MDKQLIEFDNAVEALGNSIFFDVPPKYITDVQQFREYFDHHTDAKLRQLGLRLIDECTAFGFMYRASVDYNKLYDKTLEIGHLRGEVTRRGLRSHGGAQA